MLDPFLVEVDHQLDTDSYRDQIPQVMESKEEVDRNEEDPVLYIDRNVDYRSEDVQEVKSLKIGGSLLGFHPREEISRRYKEERDRYPEGGLSEVITQISVIKKRIDMKSYYHHTAEQFYDIYYVVCLVIFLHDLSILLDIKTAVPCETLPYM